MGRVTLFPRRLLVRHQDGLDEVGHRIQSGSGSLRWRLLGRQRAGERLSDHSAVNAELAGYSLDRAHPELVFASDLLE